MTSYPRQYNSTLQCDDVKYYPSSMMNDMVPLVGSVYTFDTSSLNGDGYNQNGIKAYDSKSEPREEIVYKMKEPFVSAANELVTFAIWGRIYSKDKPIHSGYF
jgi:hypothetical protein